MELSENILLQMLVRIYHNHCHVDNQICYLLHHYTLKKEALKQSVNKEIVLKGVEGESIWRPDFL